MDTGYNNAKVSRLYKTVYILLMPVLLLLIAGFYFGSSWHYFIASLGLCLIIAFVLPKILKALPQSQRNSASLEKNSEQLKEVLQAAEYGIWGLYIPSDEMTVNEKWAAILGYDFEDLEMPIKHWERLIHPDDLPLQKEKLNAHLEGKTLLYEAEYRMKCKSGEWKWIHGDGRIVERDTDGRPLRIVGTQRDITKRKIDEEALKNSEERFRRAVLYAPFPIMIHAEDGEVIQINKVWLELTGYDLKEIPNIADWAEKACGNDAGSVRAKINRLYGLNGKIDEGDQVITTKSGEKRIWHFSSARLGKLSDGRETIITSAVDLTDRKHAEEEQSLLEARLLQAQKMDAVGQLAGGVAHDFNNLLQAIRAFTEIVMKELPTEGRAWANLEEVIKANDRAAVLVKQLLAFGRRDPIKLAYINLNDAIINVKNMLQRILGEQIELTINSAPNLDSVYADAGQIEQILVNLCMNAHDAMPNGGRVMIQTGHARFDDDYVDRHTWAIKGDFVLLTVSDTGVGMLPDVREHIFEPFYTTKETGKGTGLGLSTVYSLVKRHGGFINVYSEPDQGTTFRIYFPAWKREAEVEKTESSEEGTSPDGVETILLSEDDELVRTLSCHMLENVGFTVIVAKDGQEAIDLFDKNRDAIDLLLLDAVMPKKSGQEVYNHVRNSGSKVPVIFSSGYIYEVLSAGPAADDDYDLLSKPYSFKDLLRKTKWALEKRQKTS